ncbi:MAG: extracellular solute-binding protein [Rhodobacteraceae bacterium]|jgi:raffinose/stachyose/melibiose transport system substrate-binding protein|nr:extracellular solute-binding protein [Paracoccaceae bacterium]MBT6546064.1 extracellular solute-binding protein [Paracoccaceae bacterium]
MYLEPKNGWTSRRITSVLLVAGLCISGVQAAAEVTITALLPFTKIDSAAQMTEDLYARFHEANPDITIEFDYLEHDAYHTKMQTLAISGNLPTILTLWPGKRTGYLTDTGYAMDLRAMIEADNIAATQKAVFLSPQGANGEIYELGMPLVNYSNVVYANKALLGELGLDYPATLAQFEQQASEIIAAGIRPVVYGDQSAWVMQSCMLSMLTARIGGLEWFDQARRGDGANFADAEFVNSLETITRMVESGLISESEPSTTREQAMSLFVSGRSAYMIGGIWEVSNLKNALTEEQQATIGMYTFPEIEGQLTSSASSSGALNTGYGISVGNSEEDTAAAWEWIKFVIDYSNADIATQYGSLPVYAEGGIEPFLSNPLDLESYRFSSGIETVLPVLDDKMDAEGVNEIINKGLQELILGDTTAEEIAQKYETWVAANDSNRL